MITIVIHVYVICIEKVIRLIVVYVPKETWKSRKVDIAYEGLQVIVGPVWIIVAPSGTYRPPFRTVSTTPSSPYSFTMMIPSGIYLQRPCLGHITWHRSLFRTMMIPTSI